MIKSEVQKWFEVIRPILLWTSITPVLIGTAMAFGDGIEHWPSAFAALLCAILVHIGINLAHDYYDSIKITDQNADIDSMEVISPARIKPVVLKRAIIITFLFAMPACYYLINRGGWPIAIIAVVSLLTGIFYMDGRQPLRNLGLGDIFVLIFLGPIACASTYYVQSLEMNAAVLLAGFAPGLLSVGIHAIDNIRDLEDDRQSGKRTLAVRFGRSFVEKEYLFVVCGACIFPIFIYFITSDHVFSMLTVLTLFFAFLPIKLVLSKSDEPSFDIAIRETVKLFKVYLILFSLGWIL